MARLPKYVPHSEYSAAIGTVLREWRASRGRSRAMTARQSGLPLSRLAMIERGEIYPDEATIEMLAASFDSTASAFWARVVTVFQERLQLQGLLEVLGIPRENWGEFDAIDATAREDFIRALEDRMPPRSERRVRIQEIEDRVENDGVEFAVPLILDAINKHGLSPTDHFRASVELEEMPGDRSVFTDRLPISAVSVPMDQLFMFRASYGIEPPNPLLLKWWADARRTAMNFSMQDSVSRTIVPLRRLIRYIRTGERGESFALSLEVVTAHLVAFIELLRTQPHFELGLTERELPLTYRIKGDHHALVTVYGRDPTNQGPRTRATLLFSRSLVVARFNEHFRAVVGRDTGRA